MRDDARWERFRFNTLRFPSRCTPVQVERRAREVFAAWLELRAGRKALDRDMRVWLDDAPRRLNPVRPFCFVLERMKRKWREADRSADLSGFPVHRTVGSTRAREDWFGLLSAVLLDDEVIRVRHRYHDGPAILISESRFRALEKATGSSRQGSRAVSGKICDGVSDRVGNRVGDRVIRRSGGQRVSIPDPSVASAALSSLSSRSCPQAAAMSRPRGVRTAASTPRARSAPAKAATRSGGLGRQFT